jgi:hypothetical protein
MASHKTASAVRPADLREFLEKRRETRYQTNDVVEVELLQPGFHRLAAFIVDVSRSGLRLMSKVTIGKGAQVKITMPKHVVIFGEVQYCRPVRGGFQSGILIQDMFYPQQKSVKDKARNGRLADARTKG